jgi:hypothetical protein
MKAALQILAVLMYIWCAVSPLVFIAWAVFGFPRSSNDAFSPVKPWVMAVGMGTFLCFMLVIYSGVNEWLIFIPESWGSTDDYGEFVSARRGISSIVGFAGALGVFYLLGCYATQRDSERKRKTS